MKSLTRKAVRLGVVAGLAVGGLVGVTSLTAAGTGIRPMVPYGTLTITLTDRAGSLTLAEAGGATFTQALGVATPCSTLVADDIKSGGVVVEETLNLLNFSAAVSGGFSPNVQLPSNGIGVTDGANCGGPAGLIGPGETLTLDLGGFLPSGAKISTGTLQIGKSRGNDGDLRVAYDGGNFGTISVPVGVTGIPVTDTDSSFESISIRSTASQSSRGLSLQSTTVFNLVAPAPATVPDAPTGVTAARGNAQATVSWGAPADGGSPINGYQLEYRATSSPTWIAFPTTEMSSETVTGLANGTEYIFRVAAVNGVGTSTFTESNAVTPATVPDAPPGVAAVRGDTRATVSWGAPSDGGSLITGYVLRYYPTLNPDSTTTVTVGTTPTTRTVTGLTNGTQYTFEVSAVNDVGVGAPASTTVTPATAPDAPTDVTAVSETAGQATVSWGAPSDGGSPITRYELRYSPNTAVPTWTDVTVAPATATTQTVTGLNNGTEYIFEVRAVNDVGPSLYGRSGPVTPWTELVDCGDTVTDNGELGEIAEFAEFLRGENAAKTETACEDVGVVVEIVGNDWVYWDNSSVGVNGNPQAVQGTVTIDWAPAPVAKADDPTEIDYDGPDGPAPFVDRLWCASFSVQDNGPGADPRVVVFDGELPDYSGPGNVNGKAPWCLVSSSQTMDDGNVHRTEVFFGSGDPLAKFR